MFHDKSLHRWIFYNFEVNKDIMNVEAQRRNIVHRILDIENVQLLNQIEELLNSDIYTYSTDGKPLTVNEY